MGGAIARGLAQRSWATKSQITVSGPHIKSLSNLKVSCPDIQITTSNMESTEKADIVIIAVKPWLVESVISDIKSNLQRQCPIIISVASGISFEQLKLFLGTTLIPLTPLYRVIPNTAITVKESMTFIASDQNSSDQDNLVTSLFDEMGKTMMIGEQLMAAATALGSCGTAFALRYIRAAIEGGVELGLKPQQAQEIVAQTVKGAADLLLINGTHPEAEIDKVTTPGGITIKGLNEMELAGFSSAVIRGLKASR